MKLVIIIPAFNESATIYKVVKSLPKKLNGFPQIIPLVIDDGSGDTTQKEAQKSGALVVRHNINRGVGAATKTGIVWARKNNADAAVTFDGDGQHNPRDIEKILKPIVVENVDVVIGSRFKNRQNIPIDRLILNWGANIMTLIFFGVFSTDTQSGLRALSKKAIKALDFKTDRMEFSSELLLEAKKHKLKMKEVATSAIYTNYSRAKGQKNTNAIPIILKLILKWLR